MKDNYVQLCIKLDNLDQVGKFLKHANDKIDSRYYE